MKTITKLTLLSTLAISTSALAKLPNNSIINKSSYPIECTQMIGGYCANNPMPHKGYIKMLPDPGAKIMRGHIMVLGKDHYIDNIVFTYKKVGNEWVFKSSNLYKKIPTSAKIKNILMVG